MRLFFLIAKLTAWLLGAAAGLGCLIFQRSPYDPGLPCRLKGPPFWGGSRGSSRSPGACGCCMKGARISAKIFRKMLTEKADWKYFLSCAQKTQQTVIGHLFRWWVKIKYPARFDQVCSKHAFSFRIKCQVMYTVYPWIIDKKNDTDGTYMDGICRWLTVSKIWYKHVAAIIYHHMIWIPKPTVKNWRH